MSLVNQMLQDLELRRSAEAGASPLGGLSASGAGASNVSFAARSINTVLLGVTVALVLALALALLYLFDSNQSIVSASSPVKMISPMAVPVVKQNMAEQPLVESVKSSVSFVQHPTQINGQSVGQTELNEKLNEEQNKTVVATVPDTVSISTLSNVGDDDKKDRKAAEEVASVSMLITGAKTVPLIESVVVGGQSEVSADDAANTKINKTIRPLTSEQQAQQEFQRAVKLLGRGDQQAAQLALEQALAFEPAHVRARETLSALLLNTGRVSEAAESLSEGLRLQPSSTPLAKLYARILVNQGNAETAINIMERARPAVATDPDYYALLAVLYRGSDKHAQAAQVYQQILLLRPGVAVWWMGLALSQDAMGESAQALKAYVRAQRAGGLKLEVLQYVQMRISALAPVIRNSTENEATNGFED